MLRCLALLLAAASMLSLLHAQTLEPRLYAPAPVGTNFLLLGYGYSEGGVTSVARLEDADVEMRCVMAAYARSIDIAGDSGKVDLLIPACDLTGEALLDGRPVAGEVRGAGDIKARVSWNFYGAPALSPEAYGSYTQDLIAGTSIQLTAPTGQYDRNRLLNNGANRWAVKPGVGLSKRLGATVVELAADAEFYTANSDHISGRVYRQKPVYSLQAHLIHTLPRGIWIALNVNYYAGGETSLDHVTEGKSLSNNRAGLTAAFPLGAAQSIKLYGSSGVNTRYGTDFDTAGIAWQYRF